jgi:ERCC4-type nuclease
VIFTRAPDDSLLALRMLAEQARVPAELVLPRAGRKPKRPTLLRLHVLQGLPGIGPALARRLLGTFRSIEGVVLADEEELAFVKGVGPAKARWIRQIVGEGFRATIRQVDRPS